ncbi:hypothetical protein BCY91_13605 [Pelobium manganitolerans]|uniref:Uncharacterized protein n=1 Tax=Pelobium manganitolerans TaxID=1842495 RepID=A0A419SBE2_9SPHI|nr:hypothetical protein [Pelobium manganitolerans]RKD19618.1 hypothetical protein BCY91_13605 [Pelobium manganitolerans]
MKQYKKYSLALLLLIMVSGCKKESKSTFDIFKGLNISFREAQAADEVYVEFTLSKTASGANMAKVVLVESGTSTVAYTAAIPYSSRYSFSPGVIVLKSPNPSSTSYIIKVYDEEAKEITSVVTISYPAGKQVVNNAVLLTDKEKKSLPEGQTVYVDYTVTSQEHDIKYIWLESFLGLTDPSRVNIATLDDNADMRTYRGVVRLTPNRDGGIKYRLYVTDKANDYIGDGYTTINATVQTGYELSANKFVYASKAESTIDSPEVATNACFYSIKNKKAYTYAEATKISSDIDFGLYLVATGNKAIPYTLNLYSITGAPAQAKALYDFSSWTKRAITYGPSTPSVAQLNGAAALPSAEVFSNIMVSGTAINQAVGYGRYANLLTRTVVNSIAIGSIMYFKTPEGKYGAIFFNNFGKDRNGKYFANIDVKIEK